MQKILEKANHGVKLTVDPSIYPLSTIYAAGYVFLDKAYVYLDKDNQGKIIVWLFPKNKKESLDHLGMDFYNELLNYAHYFSNLKANAGVVKALMQRALFSVAPSLANEAGKKEIEDLIGELQDKEGQGE
jgi:His-Xaa-Ser system protein HxsD